MKVPLRALWARLTGLSITSMLVGIVLLAALPAMTAIIWTGFDARSRAEAEAAYQLSIVSHSLAVAQRTITGQAINLLHSLAAADPVRSRDMPAASVLFASILRERSELSNLFVTDASGRVMASGLPSFMGVDLSDRKYFRDVVEANAASVGDFILGRTTGKPVMVFAVPLHGADGSLAGVLGLSYFLDGYENLLEGLEMPRHARVTLLDHSGRRMVAYPASPGYPLGQPAYPPAWARMRDSAVDEGVFVGPRPTGEAALFSFIRLRLTPDRPPYLTIVITSALSEAYANANALLYRGLALAGLATVLALAIARLAGQAAIGRGLATLGAAAARLAGGDLAARVESSLGALELQQLGRNFNAMADTIETRERQLAEAAKALGKVRNQLNNILESMPSAIIGLDAAGRVTHINAQAVALFGLTRENVVGSDAARSVPFLAEHMPTMEAALRERRSMVLEGMPLRQDGDTHLMNMLFYPLVANGVEGVVIRVDDVTERERLRELMIQTEKMMSVGGLAAGMAHEINNPLGSILQAAQVVEMQLDPAVPANQAAAAQAGVTVEAVRAYLEARKVLKFIAGIREAGVRAAGIVSSMLEFSRQSDSRRAPVDARIMANKSLALAESDYDLKKKYDFRHITVIRNYPDSPVEVVCAATEIEQVLLNLLKNAAHALAVVADPTRKPTITVGIRAQPEAVVITVADNGPGMDEAVRARIFEPFYTTKPPGEGTGLGLSVSYFIIVNNHGGTIRMDSALGQGAVCTITLPRRENA
ncbi:sensory box histidine kinase [Desulfovibrio sp. DV]|uniref:ATP-binding protein n=1 Tax=Desulfovibrio sp. DV TaxID=1844708 RepID=UPI00094BB8C8|nr:ATP-binding protein [Desulfovibrio sp. DV]OLN24581.1 sensory box histidine kinase [Desulfovibrio sp. DV]